MACAFWQERCRRSGRVASEREGQPRLKWAGDGAGQGADAVELLGEDGVGDADVAEEKIGVAAEGL